jgi:hypothetical protein
MKRALFASVRPVLTLIELEYRRFLLATVHPLSPQVLELVVRINELESAQ